MVAGSCGTCSDHPLARRRVSAAARAFWQAQLQAWLAQHPQHQYEYDLLGRLWGAADQVPRERLLAFIHQHRQDGEDHGDGEQHDPEAVPGDLQPAQLEIARHPARIAHFAIGGAIDGAYTLLQHQRDAPGGQQRFQRPAIEPADDAAFDGDADRVFLVDELGQGMSGSTTTALLATRFLRLNPGATILYNLICSRAVPEIIAEHGGKGIRTKNGHSYMKQIMADTGAVFAGEHSGHYYFADNYRADSGLIATMGILGEMCRTGMKLSEIRKPLERYASSGEINTTVADIGKVIAQIGRDYADHTQDHLDGLTVDCGSWWFNVRPSNTEPLLRLNLEASTRDECDTHVAELLSVITA